MSHQNQFDSRPTPVAHEVPLEPMRTLTAEELVEVVGGPEINNGGGGTGITTNATSGTGG